MKSWYRKQLLSYFPIFLLTITVVVLVGLIAVSDISRKETAKANRIGAEYVSDTMARALNEIEKTLLKELSINESILAFSEPGEFVQVDESLQLYAISQALRELRNNNALIHSVYLYRAEDETIVLPNGKSTLAAFADEMYLRRAIAEGEMTDQWSDVRLLKESFTVSPSSVISLIKQLPLPFGKEGFAVINADVRALRATLDAIENKSVTYVEIVDREERLVMSSENRSLSQQERPDIEFLSEIPIPNTTWTIRSGIKQGQWFAWFSLISYVWVAIGIAAIALGLGYVNYIAKRNYRPIQMMVNKLESIQLSVLPDDRKADDLSFIGQALEDLIRQAKRMEQGRQESLLARRRQLFLDVLEGTETVSEADWEEGIPAFREPDSPGGLCVIIAEAGNLDAFFEENASQDSSVLRLALQSLLQDFFGGSESAWCEWMSATRIGIVYRPKPGESWSGKLPERIETSQQWIEDNFNLSFVFSGGDVVTEWSELPVSCAAALAATEHKLTRARKALILSSEIPERSADDTFGYWAKVADIAKAFRMPQERWRTSFAELFEQFRTNRTKDRDIGMVLETMARLLKKEIGNGIGASDMMRGAWARVEIENIIGRGRSIERLELEATEALNELYRVYVSVCESNSFQAVVIEMRNYIEEHFDNPDLSLKHLSDRFGMQGKNVSQIFKDAFHENFADFLLSLRIEKAKRLLTETTMAQQEIALQVGYSNSITFGRMFKRIVGITPGDYRKKHDAVI
ncbi:helix-turn-helix domain-containing protein [Paenibacillus sp. TRM 82003]|nr:helix-turn-helix domain-containing protein [Paenibacillus sp. TRM 82003]